MLAHSSKTKGKLAALEEQLRQDIFTRQLGDDQAISPELALAERFSVSRNSVRKVIEKLVNEGVLYRRQGSGTYVVPAGERHNGQDNHSLSRNIRQVVFLSMDTVLSEASFRSHGTFEPIFMGLNQVLQPRGYNLLLAHVGLDWQAHIKIDPRFIRPAEVELLLGDSSKARNELGWIPEVDFKGLITMMVDADLDRVRREMQS